MVPAGSSQPVKEVELDPAHDCFFLSLVIKRQRRYGWVLRVLLLSATARGMIPHASKHVQSFVIRRGKGGSRIAAVVTQYKIESYLKSDFSVPLLTEVQAEVFPMERYQDVPRRFGGPNHETWQWKEGKTGTRRVAEVDSSGQQAYSVPWNI
ncbi:hypothetical protein VTH06DRAFT_8206 [Thermothelomyces fergusii]